MDFKVLKKQKIEFYKEIYKMEMEMG